MSSVPEPEALVAASPYDSHRKLAVIFFFIFVLITSPVLFALSERIKESKPATTKHPASVTPLDVKPAPILRSDSTANLLVVFYMGMVVSGLAYCVVRIWQETRGGMKPALIRLLSSPSRPRPCLQMPDGFLAVAIFFMAYLFIGLGVAAYGFEQLKSSLTAGQWILFTAFMQMFLYTLPISFLILRARATGGPDGAVGFWPFWKNPGYLPEKNIAGDIALGLKVYFCTGWMMVALAHLNITVVGLFSGRPPAQNPIIDELKKNSSSPESMVVLPVLVFVAAFAAPFMEELLFRGGMYNILARNFGKIGSALITSTLFGLLHFVPSNTWPLFFMSLAFIWLYEKTGRLLAPMIMHMANNLLVTLLTLLAGPVM